MWVAAALRRLRFVTVVATAVLAAGVGSIVDWSDEGILVAIVVAVLGLLAVVVITLFAHHLDRAADLPRMLREDMPGITAKASDSLSRAADAARTNGRARVWQIIKGVSRLRSDVNDLAEEELAPAQSLVRTFNPFRVILMALSAVATPVMLFVGLVLLAVALVT